MGIVATEVILTAFRMYDIIDFHSPGSAIDESTPEEVKCLDSSSSLISATYSPTNRTTKMTTRKKSTAPVITLLGLLASFLVWLCVQPLQSSRIVHVAESTWSGWKVSVFLLLDYTDPQQDLGPFHLEEEPGRWALAKDAAASEDLTEEQREAMANLQTIGYLEGYEPATSSMGVTLHVPDIASPGFNLYSSGHGPIAVLTDMEGDILHSWKHANPFPSTKDRNPRAEFWRRVYLYEDGDLLAIYDGIGLIKLDKDSNLLWAAPCGAHHDWRWMRTALSTS